MLAKKCFACAKLSQKCVEVEHVLYLQLRIVVAVCNVQVTAMRADDVALQREEQQEFEDTCDRLIAALDSWDCNCSTAIGNRRRPRKAFDSAAAARAAVAVTRHPCPDGGGQVGTFSLPSALHLSIVSLAKNLYGWCKLQVLTRPPSTAF